MYFQHKNKTAIRSQHMIADALYRLMKRKPFHQITVTEICQEADIRRKTFYRNFELREDVITFQLDQMYDRYRTEFAVLSWEQRLQYHFIYIKNMQIFL